MKVEEILALAVANHEFEDDLRATHRMALRRLQMPDARSRHEYALWKRQERRAWMLVQALNNLIAARRYDIAIVDPEDMDEEIARLERQVAAE